MLKTTVYLPSELKQRIARLARRERRSEAAVIRAALDDYTRSREAPRPRPLFDSGKPIHDWDEAMRGFGED